MYILRVGFFTGLVCFGLVFNAQAAEQAPPAVQWQRTYGGTFNDILHCLLQTTDGGYVLGGRSISDPGTGTRTAPNVRNYDEWFVRLDANGNQLWDRSYGGTQYDKICTVDQTSDGGFMLLGWSESPNDGNKTSPAYGVRNFWVVRTDANGIKLWERSYGGSGGDTLYMARRTPDGGYILGGSSNSGISGTKTTPNYGWTSQDFWIVRIDANGNQLWDRSFGTVSDDYLHSVEVTPDGGFIIGGTSQQGVSGNKTSGNNGGPDYWVLRLDSNGNKIWDQTFGGWYTDDLYAAVPTADGGFLLGGYSESPPSGSKTAPQYGGYDLWLIKIDANGNKLYDFSFGGNAHDNFMDSFSMHRLPDGGFIIGTGTGNVSTGGTKTAPNYGLVDIWVIRIDAAGTKLWEWSGGAADTDVVNAIQMTSDGGFIFGGQSYSDVGGNKTAPRIGGSDYWVIKLASDSVVPNTPPTLSGFSDQAIDEDHATAAIPFTVADGQTSVALLAVSGRSSNTSLLPDNRVQFGGSGANRTVTATPLPDQFGNAQVSVIVADAHGARATNSFLLTVRPVNDAPIIGDIPAQTIGKNTSSPIIPVLISDAETAASQLTLTATSSDHAVVPPAGLVLGGSGSDRTLRVDPAPNQLGSSLITLTVSDGTLSTTTNFTVTVQEVVLPPANLVSQWKLDETSGTTVLDVTGRNPGVLVNNPERLPGKLGYALRFNGVNNYVNIPDSNSLDLGPNLTIGIWFKPSQLLNANSGRKDLFKKFVSYWLLLNYPSNDGRLSFVLNSGAPFVSTTTSQWLSDRWYHIAATYDGATMRLYVNGTLESSVASTAIPMVTGYPVQIGGNSEQGIFFPGLVDDVRIYNTALSAAQVRELAGGTPVPNTLPGISSIANQTIAEDSTGIDLSFSVSDSETAAADLTVSVTSSNAVVLPPGGMVLGGSGANRTLRLVPAANQFGQSLVTLTVQDSDGGTTNTSFLLTVQSVNDAPSLTAIADQLIEQGQSTGPLAFTVGDIETAAGSLTVRGTSSDQSVAPDAAITFGGGNSQRTVTVNPLGGQLGTSQITVYVSDGQIERNVSFVLTVVATNAPGSDTAYVTRTTAGLPRNDFNGWVGFRFTVGADPIRVTSLGRYAYSGDNQTHVVKIVKASDGQDVAGASATVSMTGAPVGQWKYAPLISTITLQAQQAYYLVSQEKVGGDRFGDLNTVVETTSVAVENAGAYAVASPNYMLAGGGSQTYGPPNFKYLKSGGPVTPPPSPTAPTISLDEPVGGTTVTLPASVTLRATISSGVTNVTFYHDGVLLGNDNHNPATFVWNNPAPGNYALTARAADANGLSATSSIVNITVRANDPGPVGGEQTFIASKVLGEQRNDFNGFVGMKITVGAQSLTVTALGRIVAPGNNGTHLVKLVRASDLADVPNGSVSVNTAGGTVGEFRYAQLPSPVVLQANAIYYLVSQEVLGGDRWHGVVGTALTTLNVATVNSGVFMGSGYGWSLAGTAGHSYGPVDFKLNVPSGGGGGGGTGGDDLSVQPAEASEGGALYTWVYDGQQLVSVRGHAGEHYLLQASDDLKEWLTIADHTLERDEVTIADLDSRTHHYRFYRTRLVR